MQYLGDYRIDDYITFGAQLHRFSSGAVYAPTGNATYTFYENNSTSGAPTGGNLGQLNSKTGLYTSRVQLTAAAGFEAGKEYLIHIEATVDSVAAAELLMFRIIANPKVDVDTIKTQAVTCAAGVTVLASVGTAATSTAQTGDSYARLGAPTGASVSADIAAVKGETAAILDDTDDIGIAGAGLTALGDTRLANLDATISSRGTSTYAGADTSGTTTLLGRIVGTLAAGTHNPQSGDAYASVAALNNLSSAQAQSAATAALNAYDPPTNAEMEARTLVAAGYATAAALDAVDNYIDTEIAAIKAVTDKLDTTLEADGEVYRFTVSALENAPAGGGGGTDWSVSEREQIRYRLQLDGTQTAPADTDLPAVNVTYWGGVAAVAGAIPAAAAGAANGLPVLGANAAGMAFAGQVKITASVEDEGALHIVNTGTGQGYGQYNIGDTYGVFNYGDQTGQHNFGAASYGQQSVGGNANVSGVDASGIRTAIGMAAANLDTQLGAIDDYIDTEIAAIKAKTDNLPASPAAVGSAMTLTADYDAAKTAASQASVDDLPTNAELAAALAGADDAVLAALASVPTVEEIDTALSSSHGSNSWEAVAAVTPAEIWANSSRTLTQPLPSEEEQEMEQAIRIVRGLTYQKTWSQVALPAGWAKVIWTLKDRNYYLATGDTSAKAQVVLSNPAGEADGLTVLAGAEGEAELGSLVYDENAGTLSLELADDATAALAVANSDKYDIKVLKDDDRSERLVLGDAVVAPTVTLET